MAPSSRVGFVGIGHLGALLASNLLRAGYVVTATDLSRSRAEAVLDLGGTWADSPREAAEVSDCVITCLPNPDAVAACLEGPDGVLAGLAPGGTWIDMSTSLASEVQRIAALAAQQGVRTLESPVTGGVHNAAIGRITALVGGDEALYREHEALLSAMTNPVIYIGELGKASKLKAITNMLAFCNQWAAGEALMLARAGEIDLGRAFDGIRHSSGNSWSFEVETQLVLNGSYDFQFTLDLACKDFSLVDQMARESGVPLEVAGHVEQIFRRARAHYGGQAWSTQVVKLLEDTMGLDLRAEGFPASMFGEAMADPSGASEPVERSG